MSRNSFSRRSARERSSLARRHGPDKGTLVIVGGNMQDPAIVKRFIDLAGGPDAPIVIIPTAGRRRRLRQVLVRAGCGARTARRTSP